MLTESTPELHERTLATLKATFGYDAFRPLQEEIVAAILRGQDAFVLMPTGGGKSLCYQLPALLLDGLTVVVSPLIALMQDQVDQLRTLGVAATFINSTLDPGESERRRRAVLAGEVKLLYVAPERLAMPGFLNLLTTVGVTRFAIDEAHCISEWGHDFRPDYRELKRLRQFFPETPFAGFTATATQRVQEDIVAQLQLRRPAMFRGSFNRRNLFYDVRAKQDAYGQLRSYLRRHRGESGIIYCLSRDGTERLAQKLRDDSYKATAYHAGLEGDERRMRQEAFIRDNVQIIVATVAFGMGIDKPDVRFVVHYDLPKNLEGYYQESGRAGRDSEPSDCILFYSGGDVVKQKRFLSEKPPAEQQVALRQLQQMANWAANPVCRRRSLLVYFDEPFEGQDEPCCDVCRDGPGDTEPVDHSLQARMLFACARQTGEQFGAVHLIRVLRGMSDERILRLQHDQLKTYGVGKELSREQWHHLVQELLLEGYLRQAGEYNAIRVTERAAAVRANKEPVLLRPLPAARPERRAGKTEAADGETDDSLFERLRALRKRLAAEHNVPPYVVFYDRTLHDMAAKLPTTADGLLGLTLMTRRKVEQFGEAFLRVIDEYRAEGNTAAAAPEAYEPPPPRARPRRLSPTVVTTLDLFRGGRTPAEIAFDRGLTLETIEGHIADAIMLDEDIDIDRLVSRERRAAIATAMSELGVWPLQPVLERLGDGYTYGELRLVQALLRRPSPDGDGAADE